AAAIFLGPGNTDPARGVHLFLPSDTLFKRLAIRCDTGVRGVLDLKVVGQIGVKPSAELAAEFGMLRGVGEIHWRSSREWTVYGDRPRTISDRSGRNVPARLPSVDRA